jgi:hypothetical protein
VGSQLRANLLPALPGAAGLFHQLDSAISLAFLARFGCQGRGLDAGETPGRLAENAGYSALG